MPSPTMPSTAEEEAFMAKLLANPPVTPTRHRGLPSQTLNPIPRHSGQGIPSTPTRQLYSVGQVDIEEEISGWSWDALSDYVPTPKKSYNSPRKTIRPASASCASGQVSSPPVVPKYSPDPCARCLVRTVTDTWSNDVHEKVRTQLTVHLSS